MSVLIKDREMPETCDDCPFHVYHSRGEYVCTATVMLYPMNLANSKGIRKDWCPLTEAPEPYEDKLKEIADALSEKMCYMNTCPNERDIILGYLGRKRPSKNHCNTDCWNKKCESYHYETRKQPEQQSFSCGQENDLISRQAAIDALKDRYYKYDRFAKLEELVWAINTVPSAQPEQRWIPCSERLPNSQTEVIVSCRDDSADTIYRYTASGWITTDGEYWIVDNEINPYVIAWMPLPKPYKGDK